MTCVTLFIARSVTPRAARSRVLRAHVWAPRVRMRNSGEMAHPCPEGSSCVAWVPHLPWYDKVTKSRTEGKAHLHGQ